MAAKKSFDKQTSNRNKWKSSSWDAKKRKYKSDDGHTTTPANKKRALKQERQSHRKHATTVRSSKEIWNELRVKTNDRATNAKLCTELHELLKGKYMEVAMQHDASRCVQGVLQFGDAEQRRAVVVELCEAGNSGGGSKSAVKDTHNNQNPIVAELCKIQYAHFVVLKMIKYCARDDACSKLIVKSLKKQMTKLAVHAVGSRVVELLFAEFPPKATAPLKMELYGPQYALFSSAVPRPTNSKSNVPTLPALSAFIETNPDKLESTVTHLQSILQKGLDKSLTGFSYFHSLLLDYTSIATPNDIRSFLTPALAEHSLHLISTRAGTKVVCECMAYGTVKHRKKIIKCFKGYARSSMLHRDAYLAILRMCDVMDDTVLVNKMLLAELQINSDDSEAAEADETMEEEKQSPILDLVLSETGAKLFFLLLTSKDELSPSSTSPGSVKKTASTPRWKKYFDPYEIAVLHRNPTVEENDQTVATSKKEDETRRQELAVYLKELLVEVCVKHTETMMRSKPGSRVLMEVCNCYPREEVFNAIVEVCSKSYTNDSVAEDDGKSSELPILEDAIGHLTLKHLFLSESEKKGLDADANSDDEPSLALMFYSKFQKNLGDIACTNRGAFVLSALIQNSRVREEVKEALKSHTKNISSLAKGRRNGNNTKTGKPLAGCGVLLDLLKA